MNRPFQITARLHSFKYAFNGLRLLLRSQHNAWIHLTATILVLLTGFICSFRQADWCWVVLAMVAVWTAEAFNTALEFLADAVTEDSNPLIAQAKDVAAAAVLIMAVGAVIIGVLVIGPYLREVISF